MRNNSRTDIYNATAKNKSSRRKRSMSRDKCIDRHLQFSITPHQSKATLSCLASHGLPSPIDRTAHIIAIVAMNHMPTKRTSEAVPAVATTNQPRPLPPTKHFQHDPSNQKILLRTQTLDLSATGPPQNSEWLDQTSQEKVPSTRKLEAHSPSPR
jgi:hypothetical protein